MRAPPIQRQALLDAKLAALVRARWNEVDDFERGTFPGGATLRSGTKAWVLAQERPERALGGALAWARSAGAVELHLLVEAAEGMLARRAGAFARPPAVWRVQGRQLRRAEPEPLVPVSGLAPEAARLAELIRLGGAEPVVEWGVLSGEVLGLEVARVVEGEQGYRLEVGVGGHDREAQRLMHPDRPVLEALVAAVDTVKTHRRAGAPAHPLNQLAAERWLRAVVSARPELVGASYLEPLGPPQPRGVLRERSPAAALGVDREGRDLIVVCSTGVDLELVPVAADTRLAHGPEARLVLALPRVDDHPVTRALAGALASPAEVVAVREDWRSLVA